MLTPHMSASEPQRAGRVRALLTLELVMGLIAVPCGALLIVNGLGMSDDVLARSPFDTFVAPGLLLAIVVGGSLLGAALLAWRHHSRAGIAGVAAGSMLLGWIVIEAIMISGGRGLQALVFFWALAIIALAWPLVASPSETPRPDTSARQAEARMIDL